MNKKRFFFSLMFLSAASLASGRAAAAERSEIPEKYKWNTADLYQNDSEWAKKRDELTARIPGLSVYQGKLGLSGKDLFTALDDIMSFTQELDRLAVYASMRSDEDTRVGSTRQMDQSAKDTATKASAATAYLTPEIIALGREKIYSFIEAESRLKPYKVWLDNILRYAPHTLSPAEEKIAAQAGLLEDAPGSAYSTFTNSDLPYPTIKLNGKDVRLDAQGYTLNRTSIDRDTRTKVFKTFWAKYREFENTLGTTLNAHVNTHIFDRDVHKYGSCLEAALFSANVPTAVYRRLIADTHANLPTLHRYLKLRKRIMGLDQIGYEDLYAPLTKKEELRYTPEEARKMVFEATAPLGPQYAEDLKTSFDNRWVDFMPSTGKKSGAYSTGVYGVHPYQLQNFTGLYDEVSTVAHESGHSMHSLLSARHQPYISHDYKIFVAEVASTLNENLLFRHMMGKTKDKAVKLYLLGTKLDGLRTTLFRQTLFAEFEMLAHETAEKGEPLTGEKLTSLYLGLLKQYYGDKEGVCKIDDLYGIEWAYIPHFYYNFYVYQYATSITASALIADDIMAEQASGETAKRDAYLKMLSSGSSKEPIELLKDVGADMTTSAPFNAAIKEMNTVMDEIEKLL
jgi:oligoendopeptidase F